MDYSFLISERGEGYVKLVLNRPSMLNALNVELFSELRRALVEVEMDPSIQIAIITGAGRAFCSGADLKSVVEHHKTQRGRWIGAYEYSDAADALFAQIRDMNKIVVTMVNGTAQGGGLVLATCSDIAVSSDQATFRIPEALAGIADELSTTWLQACVGLAKAKYLVLTGEQLTAIEAERLGLIAKVVPHDELWPSVLDVVGKVLQSGPRARSIFKRIMNGRLPRPDARHILESHLSDESREGCAAFAERRKPAWVKA